MVKRSPLLAVILVALLVAAAPAFAQEEVDPDTPVSGRPGEDPAAPSDCQALRATGADIDCGVLGDVKAASEDQYAGDDQYGADNSSSTGVTGMLPSTGGSALLPLSVGGLLITGGLLARRLTRLRR